MTRAAEFTRQRIELEREIDAQEAAKKYEAGRPARALKAQEVAEAKRQLRKALLTDVSESIADFEYTKYDGRLDAATPGVVTKAIQDAWATFTAEHPELTKTEMHGVTLLLGQYGADPDIAKPEVFEQALSYINTRLAALDPQPEPVSVLPAEPTEEVCPFPANSRGREEWDRKKYAKDLLNETLGNDLFSNTVQEMVTQSGLSMSGDVQFRFRKWLDSPESRRRFGATLTRESIRLGAASFFADQSFLTDAELAWIDGNRAIESMTSEQVKLDVGFRNDYSPEGRGYRAGR